MKILVVASLAHSLLNFRGRLLAAMVRLGHEVTACAPEDDSQIIHGLARIGVDYRQIPMDRVGLSPIADLRTLRALLGLVRSKRPNLVIVYTQKPIIYGGLAVRLAGRGARLIVMVSGLGYICTEGGDRTRLLVRPLMTRLFRIAVRGAYALLVFNRDDGGEMRRQGMVSDSQKIIQIPGSGVDLLHFAEQPLPDGPPVFLMVARLLRDKGILEYVEAARLVRGRHPSARFQLLGPFDPNPSAVSAEEVRQWVAEGTIEYLGATDDVRPYFRQATVFVLPSYREGLPRSALEAMATGRPIVTTDAPGCREIVSDGNNGFLVAVGNAGALADAMSRLIEAPELVEQMGRRSRKIASDRYSVDQVNAVLLDLMGLSEAERDGASSGPQLVTMPVATAI